MMDMGLTSQGLPTLSSSLLLPSLGMSADVTVYFEVIRTFLFL